MSGSKEKGAINPVIEQFGPLLRGLVTAMTKGVKDGFEGALQAVAPQFRRRYIQSSFSDKLVGPKPGMDSLFTITLGKDIPADVDKKEFVQEVQMLERQCEGFVRKWQDEYIDYLKERGFEFPESKNEKRKGGKK